MNNCREEFEEWLASELAEDMEEYILNTNILGCYKNKFVHESWIAWKAGWKRHQELSE